MRGRQERRARRVRAVGALAAVLASLSLTLPRPTVTHADDFTDTYANYGVHPDTCADELAVWDGNGAVPDPFGTGCTQTTVDSIGGGQIVLTAPAKVTASVDPVHLNTFNVGFSVAFTTPQRSISLVDSTGAVTSTISADDRTFSNFTFLGPHCGGGVCFNSAVPPCGIAGAGGAFNECSQVKKELTGDNVFKATGGTCGTTKLSEDALCTLSVAASLPDNAAGWFRVSWSAAEINCLQTAVVSITSSSYMCKDSSQAGGGLVNSDLGRTSTVIDVATSPPPPKLVADFTATPVDGSPLALDFDASPSQGSPATWSWDFGDHTTLGTTQTIRHTYAAAGSYVVTLTVGAGGTTAMTSIRVQVPPGLTVNTVDDDALKAGSKVCDTGKKVGTLPACSLRAAIKTINAIGGGEIAFAIPGDGTPTISPLSPLPAITVAASVDGTTQQPAGTVELSGASAGSGAVGLSLTGGHSTVRGMVINGFGVGVQLSGGTGSTVAGNYLGTSVDGTTAVANDFGVDVSNSTNNTVGGSAAADRNVIVASSNGVEVDATTGSADGNTITGNYIGTNAAGTAGLVSATTSSGVFVLGAGSAAHIMIADNTVSGTTRGVVVLGKGADSTTVSHNRIGTTADGSAPIAGGSSLAYGVRIDAAPHATVSDNVIAGATWGVSIAGSAQGSSSGGQIFLNPPSTTATGTPSTVSSSVTGNIIGLLADGATRPDPKTSDGFVSWAGAPAVTLSDNTIVGTTLDAELIGGSGHTVSGNRLGISAIGNTTYGAGAGVVLVGTDGASIGPDNTITGGNPSAISVGATSTATTITANRIGIGADGFTPLGNSLGIIVASGADGTTIGPGNVIGSNSDRAIDTAGTSTTITKNFIGVPAVGTTNLGNGTGIRVSGGDADIEHNTVAHGTVAGVVVSSAGVTATILHNAIFDNAGHLGISSPFSAPHAIAAARVTRVVNGATQVRTWLALDHLPSAGGTLEVFGNVDCGDPEGRFPLFTRTIAPGTTSTVATIVGRLELKGFTATMTTPDKRTSVFTACGDATVPYADANGDGIPDIIEALSPLLPKVQPLAPNLASFPNDSSDWVALSAPVGMQLSNVGPVDNPDPGGQPSGVQLPAGLFAFTLSGLKPGGAATVLVATQNNSTNAYWRYGPPSPGAAPGWFDWAFDNTSSTGAQHTIDGWVLHFVDGARGDDDSAANGVVQDPGGPAADANPQPSPASPVASAPPIAAPFTGAPSLAPGLLLLVAGAAAAAAAIPIRRRSR